MTKEDDINLMTFWEGEIKSNREQRTGDPLPEGRLGSNQGKFLTPRVGGTGNIFSMVFQKK